MQFSFADHTFDTDRRELRHGGEPVAVEPQVFDLLTYLIHNRDRVVSKDDLIASIWGGRIVSESTLTSRINAARTAVGDSGKEQRLIRTIARKGVRFVAEIREGPEPCCEPNGAPSTPEPPPLRQEVRFCTTPDNVRLAYASVGEGPILVKVANWLNHLEYDWESPVWNPLLRALASRHRLIRYDARGNGLSDRAVDEISFEAFVRDLETVVDAAGLDRFPLLGISQGAAVAVAYAVRHPERVSALVLYGGYVRGQRRRGTADDVRLADALVAFIRAGWGQDNPAFRQIFTSLFIPGGTPEQVQWWNDLQRKTASPDVAARIRHACNDIDVTELLPLVQAPTLVLHCREDAVGPFEEGRRLASGIPNARFVALEGRNHAILQDDPAWPRFLQEVLDFLRA